MSMTALKILVMGIFLSSLCYGGPLTLASDSQEVSLFEKVGTLFKEGVRPQLSLLSNRVWVGRCFFRHEPNKPVAAILAAREVADPAGPIAPRVYEARSWISREYPEIFDHDTYKNIDNILNLDERLMFPLKRTKDFYYMVHPRNGSPDVYNSKQSLKMNHGYLIMEVREQKDVRLPDFTLSGRCYYFKSVEKN